MKKILSVLMVLVLVCSSMLMLVACGGDGGNGGVNPDDITLGSLTEKPEDYSVFSNEYVTFYYPSSWESNKSSDDIGYVADMTTGLTFLASVAQTNNEKPDSIVEDLRRHVIEDVPDDITGVMVSEVTMIKENVYTFEQSFNGQTTTFLYVFSVNDDGNAICYIETRYSIGHNMEQITTIINSIQFAN
ncbi:MAG: hypothetical protein IJW54_01420 [Clostridia bacterium]|nr:hypothetical protein [Clostridia bacterium]